MKKIRIGKDIRLDWTITIAGGEVPLASASLEVEMTDRIGRKEKPDFEVDGDKLVVSISGKKTRSLGTYWMTCWYNRDKDGRSMVDKVEAFELVRSTEAEGGDDADNITTATVSLEGEIVAGIPGEAATIDSVVAESIDGTEASAVNEGTSTHAKLHFYLPKGLTTAEHDAVLAVVEAEAERQSAEEARQKAETERQQTFLTNEAKREQAAATQRTTEAQAFSDAQADRETAFNAQLQTQQTEWSTQMQTEADSYAAAEAAREKKMQDFIDDGACTEEEITNIAKS